MVGTGTEVGKTWVAAELLSRLRHLGVALGARKLAQSFDPSDLPEHLDAAVLGAASGEEAAVVCPEERSFPVAMAPPMAAEALGRPVPLLAELLEIVPFTSGTELGLLETAGGLRSPQAADGDACDVIAALSPEMVILVADAGLGAISDVRLCHAPLAALCSELVVVLNRFDFGNEIHRRNRRWLTETDGFDVVVGPEGLDELARRLGRLLPSG